VFLDKLLLALCPNLSLTHHFNQLFMPLLLLYNLASEERNVHVCNNVLLLVERYSLNLVFTVLIESNTV
jgi:hypothetical protein